MELSTAERIAPIKSTEDEFQYTEFALDWREPLPPASFGNRRFMWGCVACAVVFMVWMSGGK